MRHRSAKLLALLLCILLACSVLGGCAQAEQQKYSTSFFDVFDTVTTIIGYADTLTAIYVASKFPTWLFLSAVSLFAVGVGVLSGLLFKRWKGKPHDR